MWNPLFLEKEVRAGFIILVDIVSSRVLIYTFAAGGLISYSFCQTEMERLRERMGNLSHRVWLSCYKGSRSI
jgi:hypothetical protein